MCLDVSVNVQGRQVLSVDHARKNARSVWFKKRLETTAPEYKLNKAAGLQLVREIRCTTLLASLDSQWCVFTLIYYYICISGREILFTGENCSLTLFTSNTAP